MPERVAVYPGSFDPPTFGHLDIIERAASIFDRLVVAVAWNSEKDNLFSGEEREEMLKELTAHMKNVQVLHFKGLTVDLAKREGAVAIIRGLRAVSDFEYEMTMAATNRKLYEDCDTVCLMPSEQYMFISSRLVKEIVRLGGAVDQFVPPNAIGRMRDRLRKGA